MFKMELLFHVSHCLFNRTIGAPVFEIELLFHVSHCHRREFGCIQQIHVILTLETRDIHFCKNQRKFVSHNPEAKFDFIDFCSF